MKALAKHVAWGTTLAAILPFTCTVAVQAAEWEKSSPYYEDDALLDITEWFDGNDYNPTDEAIGVWDDEVYNASAVESDVDDDWYGYDDANEADNWYYDYYDDDYAYFDYGDDDGLYEYSYSYYDFDDDAYYDAYSSSFDSNDDGILDEFTYMTFGDATTNTSASGDQAQAGSSKEKATELKRHAVTGKVESTKTVKVRSGDRLVAKVTSDEGKTVVVDLGPKEQAGSQDQSKAAMVKDGRQITAHGPMVKVGEKQVMLAQSVKVDDQAEQRIDRSGRQISGKIAQLKAIQVRGQDHQIAILDLKQGKQIAVDLGASDKLEMQLAVGDQIDVRGIPVKVKDKAMVIANSVTKDGKQTHIERMAHKEKSQTASK